MKRVLVVDDSAFARKMIKDILNDSGELEVVDTAFNGQDALAKLERLNPDAITMDIEMPVMNGLETLARIMEIHPTPVVMLSSLTGKNTSASVAALELGAFDVIAKPIASGLPQLKNIAAEIVEVVTAAANTDAGKLKPKPYNPPAYTPKPTASRMSSVLPVVVIASSTGGPRALRSLIPRLSTDIAAFYLVVQHLPVGFTEAMARDLNKLTSLSVREAVEGDVPTANTMLVAPAGKHCEFTKRGKITLTTEPLLWGVRPAADISMSTAGSIFANRCVGVVLTGMGRDGAYGLGVMRSHGGRTLAEAESSCVIYGMPKVAIDSGAAEKAVDLDEMPDAIAEAIRSVIAA